MVDHSTKRWPEGDIDAPWTKSPLMNIDKDGNVEYVVNPNRIEALRAASRVVAAETGAHPMSPESLATILAIAEQFVKWLEEE